jgi:hypothetical protein
MLVRHEKPRGLNTKLRRNNGASHDCFKKRHGIALEKPKGRPAIRDDRGSASRIT